VLTDVSTPRDLRSCLSRPSPRHLLRDLSATAAVVFILFGSPPSLAQSQDPRPGDDHEAAWEPAAGAEERAVESWFYAMDTGGGDGSGTLFRLGVTASGGFVGVEVVGETGVRDVFDIAFLGGRLFGIGPGTSFGTTNDVLIEIDPRNGASTGVGTIDPAGNFNALVSETATTLLAASTAGEVWRIDPFALTAARVGSFGSGFGSSGDLALTPAGVLYGTLVGSPSDALATIDRTTGRASPVGSIGFREAYGLAVNPVNNALLGVVDGERNPKLVIINRGNGAATVIGAIPVPHGIGGIAAGPAPATGCPAGFFADPGYPGFCFRVTIGDPGSASAGTREPACLPETVCVSGALPGRSELFVRIIGPRPNGFLWPTIVRFTPSRVVVDIRQKSSGQTNQYLLPAIPPGVDELSGLQDRTGFLP
jgi:hypothetical protein